MASRAFSLRGRPGGRLPLPFSLGEGMGKVWRITLRYHIILFMYLESDTNSIESKCSSSEVRWGRTTGSFILSN